MAVSALQLLNSDGDPRGNRYTDADREAGFLAWATIARRSFAVTSEKTGVAENTLRQWAKAGDWTGRAKVLDAEAAELAKVAVLSAVVGELDRSLTTLVTLRDDASQPGKVRLDAALSLLNIAGVSTRQTTATVTTNAAGRPAQSGTPRLTEQEREHLYRRVAALGMPRTAVVDSPYPSLAGGERAGD